MNNISSEECLIIGGGIIGLVSALAMRQRGYTVEVVEAHALPGPATQRVYAVNHQSIHLLESLGVWQALSQTNGAPYQQMRVADATGQGILALQAQSIARRELGFIIEHDALKIALITQCLLAGVILHSNTTLEVMGRQADSIYFQGAQRLWRPALIMITDGAQSPTRNQLGIAVTTWPYPHHAIVTSVRTEKSHQYTAYQRFYPEGPLAFLPLHDPHQCSIVWSTQPQQADHLMQLDEAAFNTALTERFADQLGHITTVTPRQRQPLYMRQARQYSGKNWLLLGDAAHTIHPLAGLGLNLGLADLACWLKHLPQRPHYGYANSLNRYQRERQSASWSVILLMEALNRVFSSTNSTVNTLRSIGLNTMNHLPTLQRALIDYATNI